MTALLTARVTGRVTTRVTARVTARVIGRQAFGYVESVPHFTYADKAPPPPSPEREGGM